MATGTETAVKGRDLQVGQEVKYLGYWYRLLQVGPQRIVDNPLCSDVGSIYRPAYGKQTHTAAGRDKYMLLGDEEDFAVRQPAEGDAR